MAEQRRVRARRIFFSVKERMEMVFAFSDCPSELFTAKILNLSEGGIGLAMARDQKPDMQVGQELVIRGVKGERKLEFIIGTAMKIKWMTDYQSFKNIGLGCAFIRFPQDVTEKIRQLIHLS